MELKGKFTVVGIFKTHVYKEYFKKLMKVSIIENLGMDPKEPIASQLRCGSGSQTPIARLSLIPAVSAETCDRHRCLQSKPASANTLFA